MRIFPAMSAPAQPNPSHRAAHAVPSAVAAADLIACPRCDALHHAVVPPPGGRSSCTRCGTTLIAPRRAAAAHVVVLAATSLVLMVAAVFLPFIGIAAGGLSSKSSIFDAAMAFAGGAMAPLSFAVLAMIVLAPLTRTVLTLWAIGPLAIGWPLLPGAAWAFRLDEEIKPWAMAEIFVIGVSIALIKIANLATVSIGPAFWLFAGLVVVSALQDSVLDRWTLWQSLEEARLRRAVPARGVARA